MVALAAGACRCGRQGYSHAPGRVQSKPGGIIGLVARTSDAHMVGRATLSGVDSRALAECLLVGYCPAQVEDGSLGKCVSPDRYSDARLDANW